jgi:hypothetical protein
LRRPGRVISSESNDEEPPKIQDVDNMLKGIKALAHGGLKKWVVKTTWAWGLREDRNSETAVAVSGDNNGSDNKDDMWEERDEELEGHDGGQLTFGIVHSKGGEMVIEYGEDDDIDNEESLDRL